MSLPVNFSFFSELLEYEHFLNIFKEFKDSRLHNGKNLYATEKQKYKNTVASEKYKYTPYNDGETSIAFLYFDEDGYPLFKWHSIRTNHTLIYSHFIHHALHYYYIFAFISSGEYADITSINIIKTWHARAKDYRSSTIHHKNSLALGLLKEHRHKIIKTTNLNGA